MQRLLAAVLLALGTAGPAAQSRPAEIIALEQSIAGREQQPAEQVFKNIQTLKGMPAIRVLRIMEQAFVPNLGVTCSHCHVDNEYDSDAKPTKGVARNMWTMRAEWQEEARKASGNPQAIVTCYTCHKGQPKPAFAPR
jgi:photosynthetic reaction center cytochrome c subunit